MKKNEFHELEIVKDPKLFKSPVSTELFFSSRNPGMFMNIFC